VSPSIYGLNPCNRHATGDRRNASYNDNKYYSNETGFIGKLSARRKPHVDFLNKANFSEFENDVIENADKGDKVALHELQAEISHSAQWKFYAVKAIFEFIHADEPEMEEPWKWTGKQPGMKNEFPMARWDS
jgi:hypothetical protein